MNQANTGTLNNIGFIVGQISDIRHWDNIESTLVQHLFNVKAAIPMPRLLLCVDSASVNISISMCDIRLILPDRVTYTPKNMDPPHAL